MVLRCPPSAVFIGFVMTYASHYIAMCYSVLASSLASLLAIPHNPWTLLYLPFSQDDGRTIS